MATSDNNGNMKIWDLRTYKMIKEYKSNSMITNITYSQRGLLAFSTGRTAVIWNCKSNYRPMGGMNELKDRHKNLYLQHTMESTLISSLHFCPYEDILGIGHKNGFSSICVPGAGEPNYDIFEADPFETKRKRNNKIVHQLLDKLPADMIQMNPNFIANLPKKHLKMEGFEKFVINKLKNVNVDDKKFARKNVNRNVKNGYRGVIRKRYSKYHHMKDLHLRQEKLIKQLNIRKKLDSKSAKIQSMKIKSYVEKKLMRKKNSMPSALQRFSSLHRSGSENRKTNHTFFKSKWRRRAKKIYF